MVILKFGGSSVADGVAIERVAAIVAGSRRPACVVVSALAGVTDALIEAADLSRNGAPARALDRLGHIARRHAEVASGVRNRDLRTALLSALDELWLNAAASARHLATAGSPHAASIDALVASGELASSRVVAALLRDRGLPACWVDARRVVITNARHGQAAPIESSIRRYADAILRPVSERLEIPVLGGFIGAATDGTTTTLGRGGSDYSAALIGFALGASEVQIWTDVDGLLTADPRLVANTRLVNRLSYAEASALAHFGAKVLHPSTVHPAVAANIPVRILNSFGPDRPGTLITGQAVHRRTALAGLAARTGLCGLAVRCSSITDRTRAMATLASGCEAAGLAIHLAATTDTSVALVIDAGPGASDVAAAAATVGHLERHDHLAIVACVGDQLGSGGALRATILRALEGIPLYLIAHAPGGCHFGAVIAEPRLRRAMSQLHARFFDGNRGDARISADHCARRRGDGALQTFAADEARTAAQESWV